jgi:hypothetical protein
MYYVGKNNPSLTDIRSIPAIDAIVEAVGRCAELGKPVFASPGSMVTTWSAQSIFIPSVLALAQSTSQQCAELDVPLYTVVGDPQMKLYYHDAIRTGYMMSGHMERYDEARNFFTGSIHGAIFDTMGVYENYDCGSAVLIGAYQACSNAPVYEFILRKGGLLIAGEVWAHEACQAAMAADYMILPPDMQMADVYLGTTTDPDERLFVLGLDAIKVFFIALIIVFCIRYALGL